MKRRWAAPPAPTVERWAPPPKKERRRFQPDRGVALEASELSVDLQEDFLEQIFAVLGRSGHPAGQRVDACGMLTIERFERADIARLAPADEIVL